LRTGVEIASFVKHEPVYVGRKTCSLSRRLAIKFAITIELGGRLFGILVLIPVSFLGLD